MTPDPAPRCVLCVDYPWLTECPAPGLAPPADPLLHPDPDEVAASLARQNDLYWERTR